LKEIHAIRIGCLAGAIGFMGYALSNTKAEILLSGFVESMDVVAFPALRSLLSQSVNRTMQGEDRYPEY